MPICQKPLFMSTNPLHPEQLTTLLISLGNIGAQTGYPALNVSLTASLEELSKQEADLLLIGTIPQHSIMINR